MAKTGSATSSPSYGIKIKVEVNDGDLENNMIWQHQQLICLDNHDSDQTVVLSNVGDNGIGKAVAAEVDRGGRESNLASSKFAAERQRRDQLNSMYTALRNLIPNPTKMDRASILGDAIEYIKELSQRVNELENLVEKKRCSKEAKRRRPIKVLDEENPYDVKVGGDFTDQCGNGALRSSSWLQMKLKNAEVDIRLIDDNVAVKIVQKKKSSNCLLLVSKFFDELHLDIQRVAGGIYGDLCTFFKTKKTDGIFASALADKLIEAMDK